MIKAIADWLPSFILPSYIRLERGCYQCQGIEDVDNLTVMQWFSSLIIIVLNTLNMKRSTLPIDNDGHVNIVNSISIKKNSITITTTQLFVIVMIIEVNNTSSIEVNSGLT